MESEFRLPFLDGLLGGGVDPGSIVLVEFDAESLWFEVAVTLAAQALRAGRPTDLHLFQRHPQAAMRALARLGLDPAALRESDRLRIIDSFTVQTGVGVAEVPKGADAFKTQSIRIADWAVHAQRQVTEGIPEAERRRLHIDDNLTVLTRYNREDEVIDYWRTQIIPLYRAREGVLVNALSLGLASEAFYRQFESLSDGIVVLQATELDDRLEHRIRLKTWHGRAFDSRWHRFDLNEHGEAHLAPTAPAGPGETAPIRELVALMFTDMVGFTRLAQADETRALRFRAEQQATLRPIFAAHRGREVKSLGDGFLVEFPSALDSVACGLEIARATRRRNASVAEAERWEVRVGVHLGDVVREGDDVVGDAVNVASRIEPLAAPGGVCLSAQVYDHVRNKLDREFVKLPPTRLKNVETPVDVYTVMLRPDE